MRVFVSFNFKEIALVDAIAHGLSRLEPRAEIVRSPNSISTHFLPASVAQEIGEADAFLLLGGPKGLGRRQEVEYYTAIDRRASDEHFHLIPVIAAGGQAPGLSSLLKLDWLEMPEVDEVSLARLVAGLKGDPIHRTKPAWSLVSPYCGLEPMTGANTDYFHGRTAETVAVLTALAERPQRCSILIGASGVGKSSIAQAGVLSALKSQRWPQTNPNATTLTPWPKSLRDSRRWATLAVRPGDTPLEALSDAILGLLRLDARDSVESELPRRWAQKLLAGDSTFADLVAATKEGLRSREEDIPDRILVYIDQSEELYTRAGKKESQRFSEVLSEGLGESLLAFASLRGDHFDDLRRDEGFFNCHERVDVPPLTPSQLEEVIHGPAKSLGVRFESERLGFTLADAAAHDPESLPLLSYRLTEMWSQMVFRGDGMLQLPDHGVCDVLAEGAETFLRANPRDEDALKRLMVQKLALVTAAGEAVRGQIRRAECTDEEWGLAVRLAERGLVATREGERDADSVAELAHETLLRHWPRLAHWLREERQSIQDMMQLRNKLLERHSSPANAEPALADDVDCSAFAPSSLRRGSQALIQVFLHIPDQAKEVLDLAIQADDSIDRQITRSLSASIRRGVRVHVFLEPNGLIIEGSDGAERSLVWRGRPAGCSFIVKASHGLFPRNFFPSIRISVDGALIGSIAFKIRCSLFPRANRQQLAGTSRSYRSAFISYSSKDRHEVLKRTQALRAAIKVFQDILDLDPGDRWQQELYKQIGECDLFLLCWSQEAKKSKWVLAEARYALKCQRQSKGFRPDIIPLVLVGPPPQPKPPRWLSHLHFNDPICYVMGIDRGGIPNT